MSKAEKKPPAKPRQRKANGYKFPDKLPAGEVIKDVKKKEWVLGPSIGKGGFGEIYSAKEASSKGNNYPYVVKIEPHENGPLFVENNFYLRVGKPEEVDAWRKGAGIKILGMPAFHGFGSHEYKNKKYRFLIIERYGKDVWSTFLDNDRQFSFESVCKYAVQIIDVLEYIHSRGYVHLDIKGANLLYGLKAGTESNVYLVDFGLACKFSVAEFKRDPKKAHNGTIEYTSRDMHLGVPTRRGDMEILGFNLLQWTVSTLPWESLITSPERVHQKKEELMSDIAAYVKKNFPSLPKGLISYLEYVAKMKHDQAPDYNLCRGFFRKELEKPTSVGAATPRKGAATSRKGATTPRKSATTPRKSVTRRSVTPRPNKTAEKKKEEEAEEEEEEERPIAKRGRRKKEEVVEVVNDGGENEDSDDEIIGPTDEEESEEESPKGAKRMRRGEGGGGDGRRGRKKKDEATPVKKYTWRDAPAFVPSPQPRQRSPAKSTTRKRKVV